MRLGIPKIWTNVFLYGLYFCSVVISSPLEKDPQYYEVQSSIISLQEQLSGQTSLPSTDAALLWTQLGSLLSFKDVRYHEDGVKTRAEAIEAFTRAIELSEGNREVRMIAYHKKGMILRLMGRGHESVEAHDSAYDLTNNDSDRSVCLQFKASAVMMMGKPRESSELYRKALQLTPTQLGIYLPLVSCLIEVGMSRQEWMELLYEMRDAADSDLDSDPVGVLQVEYLPGPASTQFHWGLYLVAEKAKEYKDAWKHLQIAHELQVEAVGLPVNQGPGSVLEQKNRIIQTFVPGFWDAITGYSTKTPVFVIGMMRSGSTLIETMLDAHPDIWGLGEDSVFNSQLPSFQADFLAEIGRNNLIGANQVISKYAVSMLDKMRYGLSQEESIPDSKKSRVRRIVDKMLFNYNNIGLLHMIYPDAPIVHMIRDPMDTIFSCYKHKFDEYGLRWTLDVDQLVEHYVAYLYIMAHFRKVLPDRIYDVRYEDLVENPEKVMRGVIHYVGVDWDPSILEYHSTNRTVQTHSSSQVRQKLYHNSIGGWVKYANELAPFISKFKSFLPELKRAGALVFPKEVNWKMDPKFKYQKTKDDSSAELVSVVVDNNGDTIDRGSEFISRNLKRNRGSRKKKKKQRSSDTSDEAPQQRKKSTKHKSGRGGRKKKNRRITVDDSSPKGGVNAKGKVLLSRLNQLCADNTQASEAHKFAILNSFDFVPTDVELGKLVSCAYILLQSGKVHLVQEILNGVLKLDGNIYQAYMALSSFYALSHRHEEAIKVVNLLLNKRPYNYRALKQRAEILSAMKLYDQAIADLTYILEYEKSNQVYFTRGLCYYHKKHYRKSNDDFKAAIDLNPKDVRSINALGKVVKEFGDDLAAFELQKQALLLDPTNKEAALDAAICQMSQSNSEEATKYLDIALKIDPHFLTAHGWMALMHDNMGLSRLVLKDMQKVLSYDPNQLTTMALGAITHCALGEFHESVKLFDRILSVDPKSYVWFRREMVYFYWKYADVDIMTYNINKVIHPRVKEGFATSSEDPKSFMADYPEYTSLAISFAHLNKENHVPLTIPERGREALKLTSKIAEWIQVDSPGFMRHERHYRMFGLAVLQTAQTLRMHVNLIKSTGTGLEIPDSSSSHSDDIALNVAKVNHHLLGWRDLFDIIIRWRQLSAPGDPIFWTDQLTQKQYSDRQGMTTYMLNGVATNVRYGPYAPFALNVTRELLLTEGYLPGSGSAKSFVKDSWARNLIENADHVSDLYEAVGEPFYVVVPCNSTINPDLVMSGTMIKLDKSHLDGWDFGICMPTSFHRYIQYEEELAAAFQRVVRILVNDDGFSYEIRREALAKAALELFFYWINFTPITRGTSASGYAVILSCVLALGEQIDTNVPKGKQLDWEAILTTHPKDFVERILPWISKRSKTDIPDEWLDGEPGFRMSEIFNTMRKMISAISGDEDSCYF